ncbi:hypothetical protein L7F22_039720 [Adiantum nelumboides]|nr:hypothetical protein [Adiantum nelumboides]
MGAKPSKHRVRRSSVVKIVLGGGKRETYCRPVSAQEVMLRYPQHVLTHLDVKDADFSKSIVTAETVLLPGNKYFLVPHRTVEWLLDQHLASTLGPPSGRSNSPSDHDMKTRSFKHLNRSFSEFLSSPSKHCIISSPQRFADEQGYLDKEVGRSMKSSLCFSPKSSLRPSPKSPFCLSQKSPLRFTRSNENNQRMWRSSPKICPGEDFSVGEEQLSKGCLSSLSQAVAGEDEVDGQSEEVLDGGGILYGSPPEDRCQFKVTDEKPKNVSHASKLLQEDDSLSLKTAMPTHLASHSLQVTVPCRDHSNGKLRKKHCQEIGHNILFVGCSPRHSKFTPDEDAVTLKWSSNCGFSSTVEVSLQNEANIPLNEKDTSSGEEPQNKSLLELLKLPDQQQCILTPAQETNDFDVADLFLQEAFDFNDCRAGFMYEDTAEGDVSFLKATGSRVNNTDEHMSRSIVESVELHTDKPIIESDLVPCLQQENARDKVEPYFSTAIVGLEDAKKCPAGQPHHRKEISCGVEDSKSSPVTEDPHSSVLQINGGTVISQAPLPSMLIDDLSQDKQREVCLGTYSESPRQDQPKENCAYRVVETLSEHQTSSVAILPFVGVPQELEAKCPSWEEETALSNSETDYDLKAVSVDNLNKNAPAKELNMQQVQTLGDVFLRRSPDYLELISTASATNGMPYVSIAPLSPEVAPLSCFLSSSTSSSPSLSSVPLSRMTSSKVFPPLPLPVSSSLPSSLGKSLLLMDFVAPIKNCSDPFLSSSKQQDNLHLLGFNCIRGHSYQAKAHARARWFIKRKPSKARTLSVINQKKVRALPEKAIEYQGKRQEAVRPSTSQYYGSALMLSPRFIRRELLRPLKNKLLSPIPEFSPEQSPASLTL